MNDPIEHTDLEIGCKYLLLRYDDNDIENPVSYVGTFKKYIDHSTLTDYPIISSSVIYSIFVDVFDYKRKKSYKQMCVSSHYSPFIIDIYKHNIPSLKELCWNMISDEDKDCLKDNYII